MSGDPDVLEYYKTEHSKKPLQIINLNFCEQVNAGLTFNRKELKDSFVVDIKTSECTFYLVAETEADMNKSPSRGSEIQPPPVNHNLKPDQKAKPIPLDLRNNAAIDELAFKSPVTKSWSRANHTFNSNSSQYCCPISTQSITNRLGRKQGELRPYAKPSVCIPCSQWYQQPSSKKEYWQCSLSPYHKPSISSVTLDEKVDYVQVDKEKTKAPYNTIQEWTDVWQSSEPSKGAVGEPHK
ncbi:hypothetical protein A6R68_11555, partial [Neotoma lepida]